MAKRILDVFSGMGLLSLGFHRAGTQTAVAMEKEPLAAKTYALNNPKTAMVHGDCTTFNPEEMRKIVGPVDGIVGGVPCEPFTLARGKREHRLADPRRHLIGYALKLIQAFTPQFFCFENVWMAPKSPSWVRAMKLMKKAGYAINVWTLTSEDYGSPQARKRAFLVGVKGSSAELAEPPKREGAPRTAAEAIADLGEPKEDGDDPLHKPRPPFSKRVLYALPKVKPGGLLKDHYERYGSFTSAVLAADKPSRTVTTGGDFIHWSKKRWMTARELARFQEVPDDYKFPCSAAGAIKLIGDAVPVSMGNAVAKRVLSFLAKSEEMDVDAAELGLALEELEKAVWTCDDETKADPKLQGQARRAERADKLTVGEFFFQPKPTRPARPEELQTVESLLKLYREHAGEWLPAYVQKKYDGANHQIHKDGDTVRIFSEDGDDNTDRLPGVVAAVQKLKADKLVATAEIEAWDGSQHLPRETVAGYLNSKDKADDSHLVANIYDVLWLTNGDDAHGEPTSDRLGLLAKLGAPQSTMGAPSLKHRLNAAPSVKADDLEELERAVRRIRKLPGSEGAVIKQVGAPYPLAQATPDYWIKFHNATTIGGVVTGREKTAGGAWVYQFAVLPGREAAAETGKVGGREVVPVGDTFATKLVIDTGDGILVEAETVNLERSADGVRLTAWAPRVMGELGRKPDTLDAVASRARKDLVLQEKDVDAKGNVEYRPTRKRARPKTAADLLIEAGPPNEWSGAVAGILGQDGRDRIKALWDAMSERDKKRALKAFEERFDAESLAMELEDRYPKVAKQADPYLEVPPDEGRYRYSVQHHWRGKGVHADLRIELKKKKLLIGWTMNTQRPGVVKEPVETLADAKRWSSPQKMDEVSKVDWNTGEWAERPKRGTDKLVRAEILSERKAPEPWAWLDVEGKTKDPEPGKAPPVGGTRQHPGVFDQVDEGVVEYGAQKPWFHEYFFRGNGLNYRMFFRQLNLQKSEEIGRCEACTSSEAFNMVAWEDAEPARLCDGCVEGVLKEADVVLPPSEEQSMAEGAAWLAIYPDDQQPYVLDAEAVKKKWMPPDGRSALPAAIRSQVPTEFRFWKKRGDAARQQRDALVEAIKKGDVEIDYEAPYKTSKASMLDADFVLQEQTWKGPAQVRVGPTRTRWWLRLDVGRKELLVAELQRNPLDNDEVAAALGRDRHRESMNLAGDVPPGHYLNPTKETPSVVEPLDRGKAEVFDMSGDLVKVRLKGKRLKGLFTLTRNDGEWLWAPAQGAADLEKRMEFELLIPVHHVEIQKAADGKEKRLVTGIVLEPNEVDAQSDYEKAETIERAAHLFLRNYNKPVGAGGTQIGLMHKQFGDIGIELVESYVAPAAFHLGGSSETKKVKKGSWVMTVHVADDTRWKEVKDGKLTGFSVGGVATVAGKQNDGVQHG